MTKFITLIITMLFLSGCSFFHVHKMDVEQGNVYTQEDVAQLHLGMSESQVKAIMGPPILANIFTPNYVAYVYTFQKGGSQMTEKKVTLFFRNGRLVQINS